MAKKPIYLWTIKAPDGILDNQCVRWLKDASIERWVEMTSSSWSHWYKKGYRAVNVELREVTRGQLREIKISS